MVYIWENLLDNTKLNAYLMKDLSDGELKSFKKKFEFGTMAPFATMIELIIQKAPEDYLDKPHAYIRRKESEAGRTGPFVLIDELFLLKGAIWYVENFASEDEVEDEMAESTEVLSKILTKVENLPIASINYEIGNISIWEDLDNCGVEMPVKEDFEQPVILGDTEGDLNIPEYRYDQPASLTAYPGEYEISTDPEVLKDFSPLPERVGRLKEDVGKEVGIRGTNWTFVSESRSRELKDGTMKEFPEGSVSLQHKYDPDFPWPAYKWPEGSL
ncbi:uncharacterized protein GGS22DRAFT_118850 [Annulohypoxylon maeteangense]|uniref:uncharacterized protein n=1 Tax=Annulohypoxylon maeteangense TaxID=1927788 RepID=UPI00200855DC|nr:uncharacterized protein GGS22DRAFT_118850 [Annulohypoxylon maeteangense]KAI0886886.1 hypothetical protein GGS22DRAFT_118850 [Annulohypoxylon maeteangense]